MRLGVEELGNLLRAHGYVQIQRPPQLWDVDTTGPELFIRAMGELLAAGLARNGNDLGTLTLGVANVHAPSFPDGSFPAGDLVAISVSTRGAWTDATWVPGSESQFVSADLPAAMAAAGAVYAYSRRMSEDAGSVTALYRRFRQ